MSKEDKIVNYPSSIDTRVALLEQSISHINQVLIDIKNDMKDFRNEIRSEFKDIKTEGKTHFRWTLISIAGIYASIIGSLCTILSKFVH